MMRMIMVVVMMVAANIHWACVKYLPLLRCLEQTVSLALIMCLSTNTLVYTQWNLVNGKSSTFYDMRPYRMQGAWGKNHVLSLSASPKLWTEYLVLRYSVITVWFHDPWRSTRILKSDFHTDLFSLPSHLLIHQPLLVRDFQPNTSLPLPHEVGELNRGIHSVCHWRYEAWSCEVAGGGVMGGCPGPQFSFSASSALWLSAEPLRLLG